MAVVIETTLGDITVDLYLDQRPVTCLNFLKLCKMKYYNYNLFHTIRSGFIAQTGDPTGEGSGGQSVFGVLEGPEKRFFSGEKRPKIRHTDAGLISMVGTGDMMVGSQFFFTLAPDLDSLDDIHCVIGEVTEGHEVLRKLNDVICDEGHRPYRDVRITHTVILEDPFNDPHGLRAPSRSPSPSAERLKGGRIAPDEEIDEALGKSAAEVQEMIEEKEAKARATILEIVGDLPDADIAPPENVLFVCKLNPVTTDDDLEIIFSRFGKIVSCEVIRDKKSGDSLQYAFIEFTDKKSCEEAYFKMDNVLIDDRRIHVDFSQSVSKMKWLGKGRGVKYFDDNEANNDYVKVDKTRKRSRSKDRKVMKVPQNDRHDHSSTKRNDRDRERYHRHENHSNENLHRHRSRSKSKHERRSSSRSKQEKQSSSRSKQEKQSSSRSKREKRSSSRTKLERRSKSRSKHERPKEEFRNEKSKHSYDTNKNSEKNKKGYRDNESNKSENDKNHGNSQPYKPRTSLNRNSRLDRSRDSENNETGRYVNEKHRNDNSKKDIETKPEDKEEQYKNNNKSKSDTGIIEPRTPSPIMGKDNLKKSQKKTEKSMKRIDKDKRSAKKKRKASTSSSDSSSESSSSSSESSSSSDEDRKKKTLKRRKKKYSTSSTSSSDSSSSCSSSDSSSSSSSSDSASKKKKSRKNKKKKL